VNNVYSSGETPTVGDRISDKRGRVGTVTAVSDGGVFVVKWDAGAAGINYTLPGRFMLISRAVKDEN
jgi:hypothetical protein